MIGSTPFEDLERGVMFIDEELMLTADEMPSANISSFLERDLVEEVGEAKQTGGESLSLQGLRRRHSVEQGADVDAHGLRQQGPSRW